MIVTLIVAIRKAPRVYGLVCEYDLDNNRKNNLIFLYLAKCVGYIKGSTCIVRLNLVRSFKNCGTFSFTSISLLSSLYKYNDETIDILYKNQFLSLVQCNEK